MIDPLAYLVPTAAALGAGQLILFWVTRGSKRGEAREERAINLENALAVERRELLGALQAQLAGEQARAARLDAENAGLRREVLTLQRAGNALAAKYDFLRSLPAGADQPTLFDDHETP